MSLKAMGLTAGQGTRLRPLTEKTAKPAIPFLGQPLLLHATRHLSALQIDEIVLNLHWCPESIRPLAAQLPYKVNFSDETQRLMGSGGGVKFAEPLLQGARTILLFNGDEVFLPESSQVLNEMYEFHIQGGQIATLLVMKHDGVGKEFGGAWTNEKNVVQKFSKTPIEDLQGFHYIGYLFMEARAFKYFSTPARDENLLYEVFTRAMSQGETVKVYPCEAQWFETGDPQNFIKATQIISKQIKSCPTAPGIADLVEFLKSSQTQSPPIVLEAGLIPFEAPSRCNVTAHLEIDQQIQGHFIISSKKISDLVGFSEAPSADPGRKDDLWKSTCVELFIGEKGKPGYREFNFSPSLDWNSYSFEAERTGMASSGIQCLISRTLDEKNGQAVIRFQFPLEIIPYEVAATAVIAWRDGHKEYFALTHSKDKPDFHNRNDWIWRLG